MSNISRRSIVTSAAALPALAMPAVVVASAEPTDDAELHRLGALFEPIEKTFHAMIAAEAAGDDLGDVWSEIDQRIFPLANEILKHQATTLEGFKIQTRALMVTAFELWDDEGDEQLAPYLRSACGLCSLPLLGVAVNTISNDLANFPATGKSKPAKTASNPKGAGR